MVSADHVLPGNWSTTSLVVLFLVGLALVLGSIAYAQVKLRKRRRS